MASLLILFYFLAVGIGSGCLAWAARLRRKYGHEFLVPLRHYLIAFFAYGFLLFLTISLLDRTMRLPPETRYAAQSIISAMAAPAWCAFVFFLWSTGAALVGWRRPRRLILAFWVLQGALILAGLAGYFFLFRRGNVAGDLALGTVLGHLFNLEIFLALGCMIFAGHFTDRPVRRKLAVRLGGLLAAGFALLYLISYTPLAVTFPPFSPFEVIALLFFALNLPPLLFLSAFLGKNRLEPSRGEGGPGELETLFAGCGLTRREREIVPLIAEGLTNDEIAARLFIAPKTVKNNISSIYQKTGLRNRVELTNRFGQNLESGT